MRSGTRQLHFATPPPPSTQRRHESPKTGDSVGAILRTSRAAPGRDGVKALDFNVQVVLLILGRVGGKPGTGTRTPVAVGAHWAAIGKNGHVYWVDSKGHRHALTRRQKRMNIQIWVNQHGGDIEALHMLRRRNGEHMLTWDEAVPYAKSHGVVLCPELKSGQFANRQVARRFVATCRKADYPCWSMALLKMANARGKCAAIELEGGHFSLIFGTFRGMARGRSKIANWRVAPSQIWGPASAKRWLVALRRTLRARDDTAR